MKGWLRRFRRRSQAQPPAPHGPAGYPAWLERRIAERSERARAQTPQDFLSILTCIYAGSPAAFLVETAESVLSQSQPVFEWVVLANGPLGDDLDSALAAFEADSRVRVLRSPCNVGIIRGLRLCLEAARGEYVCPLDGDDLLTPDAVSQIAAAILDAGRPEFLYGDEDALVQGSPSAPYFRPDWDPLLNLSSSYIWHPSVFRRQTALALGVFTDAESEFCQDWDTLFRFVDAHIVPVHMPEVLYHWRAHTGSSTHRPDRDQGSLKSQRHVLETHLERVGRAESFAVAEFPLDRGLPEWWIRRARLETPVIDVVVMGDREAIVDRPTVDLPFARLHQFDKAGGTAGLRKVMDHCDTDMVVLLDARSTPMPYEWASEALTILDLMPDVDIVGGRLIDEAGAVVEGELVISADGRTACPDKGRQASDAGYYSLSLKPHLADGVSGRFFAARRIHLSEALDCLPAEASIPCLGAWLGAWAARAGRQVAYTPLMTATLDPHDEAHLAAGATEQRALVDLMRGFPRPDRWTWREQCANLGEGRALESCH